MIHWTAVPMRVLSLGDDIATGDRVPGRIVTCEIMRRGDPVDAVVRVGAALEEIDFDGLDAAIVWLDGEDAHGPQVVLVPVPTAQA